MDLKIPTKFKWSLNGLCIFIFIFIFKSSYFFTSKGNLGYNCSVHYRMCTEAEAKKSGENKEGIKQVVQLTDKLYLELNNLLPISQELRS